MFKRSRCPCKLQTLANPTVHNTPSSVSSSAQASGSQLMTKCDSSKAVVPKHLMTMYPSRLSMSGGVSLCVTIFPCPSLRLSWCINLMLRGDYSSIPFWKTRKLKVEELNIRKVFPQSTRDRCYQYGNTVLYQQAFKLLWRLHCQPAANCHLVAEYYTIFSLPSDEEIVH